MNPDAELLIDQDDDGVDGGLRELLDDALFAVDLQTVARRHRRTPEAGTGGES